MTVAAPIQTLARELPYAAHAALKKKKKVFYKQSMTIVNRLGSRQKNYFFLSYKSIIFKYHCHVFKKYLSVRNIYIV